MKVFAIAGLGFGDEGKGSVTDHFCRTHRCDLVVRYNGGSQAAHSVVLDDGTHHTFSQFGSGTLAGAKTYLSQYMLINPISMAAEARHLEAIGISNPFGLVTVHPDAPITTPFHVAANRIREMHRAKGRHGSCGMGIGETTRLALDGLVLKASDLESKVRISTIMRQIQDRLLADLKVECVELEENGSRDADRELNLLRDPYLIRSARDIYELFTKSVKVEEIDFRKVSTNMVFEGAQGVLLDQDYGFHPYTTWTDTTFNNADKLLEGSSHTREKVGIVRSYATRHGAGPFPTELKEGPRKEFLRSLEKHNGTGDWQEGFRVGFFDAVATRYAIDVLRGVDYIAMTHMDAVLGNEFFCPTIVTHYGSDFGQLSRLKVPLAPDLKEQEKLTSFLMDVKCREYNVTKPKDFVTDVEDLLDVPVGILSWGPKPSDKHPWSM